MKALKYTLAVTSLALLGACGGGGGGSSEVAISSGTFVNSPTKGIKYSASPSGLTGTTDEDGKFSYKAGDTVTFSLDLGSSTIPIGSTSSPSTNTSILTLTVPNGGDPVAVAQVLETLDKSLIDGRMDVSGIALSPGPLAASISNALRSASVSSADIGAIAAGVQAVLSSNNSGTLKYGIAGVSKTDALTNLSKNPANQSLIESKIQALPYDGSSTLVDVQDKTAFTNWIIKKAGTTIFYSRFGVIASSGLSYSYRFPIDARTDGVSIGTYVLNNSNRDGSYVSSQNETGSFSVKTGDNKSFSVTYVNSTTGETGAFTGTYLLPLTIADVKSKSYVIYGGCPNGANNTVTINDSGVASDTCNSAINGATWTAGPYVNTLKYTEANGNRHYVGLTRLNKNGGIGNLPSGSVGGLMDIYGANYSSQPSAISFKVN